MQKREKKYIYRKCPRCGRFGYMNENWHPGLGNDPLLRQFECLSCRQRFYALISPDQARQQQVEVV